MRKETAMGIVTQYHRDTDTTYVYESESYYDPSRKQSRSRRKLIGKLDKETGEVIIKKKVLIFQRY
jgi:hypothetical protein